jgi:DNA-binding NtrC family response regulator
MKAFTASHATILLLDSDPVMRTVLHDVLQDAGYLVMKAADLGAAVDRLSEARPDVLITRPYINSMPGRIAADYLRSRRPGLPVLIVAGYMDEDRLNIQNTIEQFYTFPKPFSREDLLSKVKDVLSHTQQKLQSAHKGIA